MPKPTFAQSFATYLRNARQALGATQTDFATRLGISQGLLSAIEMADRTVTSDQLDQIADKLGIDVGTLCTGIAASTRTE